LASFETLQLFIALLRRTLRDAAETWGGCKIFESVQDTDPQIRCPVRKGVLDPLPEKF